jgi:hypothetical protein
MTGFKLGESGAVYEMLFQVPTPTSGGKSNNIIGSPWSENVVALVESEKGSLSIWRYANNTAKMMVSTEIKDTQRLGQGCCSDAVWFD